MWFIFSLLLLFLHPLFFFDLLQIYHSFPNHLTAFLYLLFNIFKYFFIFIFLQNFFTILETINCFGEYVFHQINHKNCFFFLNHTPLLNSIFVIKRVININIWLHLRNLGSWTKTRSYWAGIVRSYAWFQLAGELGVGTNQSLKNINVVAESFKEKNSLQMMARIIGNGRMLEVPNESVRAVW